MKKRRIRKKDFEIRFYEELVEKKPDFVQALSCLGNAYTSKGFYQEGLEVDKRLVRLRPHDPIVHYNLACSLSLVGDISGAFKELKKAILLGYDDFPYLLEDPDLKNLRQDRRFKEFFYKIKTMREKEVSL